MKYRKKPVVIEAYQFTQEMLESILLDGARMPEGLRFESASTHPPSRKINNYLIYIDTLKSDGDPHKVTVGDWIITGVKGERYTCKPDIFEQTYEPVP